VGHGQLRSQESKGIFSVFGEFKKNEIPAEFANFFLIQRIFRINMGPYPD
jgi:hypothetical protein